MRTLQTKTAFVLLATLASVAGGIGCGSSSSSANGENAGTTRASLHRAKGCGDLRFGDLKADASYKVAWAIDRQIENDQRLHPPLRETANCAAAPMPAVIRLAGAAGGPVGLGEGDAKARPPVPGPIANAGAATNTPTAPSASGASSGSGAGGVQSASASSYSDTNTQVAGVDEADIVKNDGKNIYVLHGRAFKVISAWPAAALKEAAFDRHRGRSLRDVRRGRQGRRSTSTGERRRDVFSAAGVTPKAPYQEYGYATPAVSEVSNASVGEAPANSPNMAPGAPGISTLRQSRPSPMLRSPRSPSSR